MCVKKLQECSRPKLEPHYQMLSSSKPSIKDSLLVIGDFDATQKENSSHTKVINAKNGKALWSKENIKYTTGKLTAKPQFM
ncbi:MAG: hypothetical protein JKY52_07965 [Flavobacteriales bacterium]|nr:hypothetical protein [Flavobacteriales bacterium]